VTETTMATCVVECFWIGVRDADVRELDERVAACAGDLSAEGEPVRYLGSILIRADEVVFCLFEGPAGPVRRLADSAGIPYERILESALFPR
jgi:hypothetical protein